MSAFVTVSPSVAVCQPPLVRNSRYPPPWHHVLRSIDRAVFCASLTLKSLHWNTYGVFSGVETVESCAIGAASTVTARFWVTVALEPLLGTSAVAVTVSGIEP